jgi:hypothetical protein
MGDSFNSKDKPVSLIIFAQIFASELPGEQERSRASLSRYYAIVYAN